MRVYCSQYVATLNSREILYLPSCLIVEMMVGLHSLIRQNIDDEPDAAIAAVAGGVDSFLLALQNTRMAYDGERIRFFIGDWKDDRQTLRDGMSAILDMLRGLAAPASAAYRRYASHAVELLTDEAHQLVNALDKQADLGRLRRTANACCYFRSVNPVGWRQVMARTVMVLHQHAVYSDDKTCLMLLCYTRLKQNLINEIAAIEEKNPSARPFHPSRLAVVSENDFPMSCPNCVRMADACRRGAGSDTVTVAHRREGNTTRAGRDTSRRDGTRQRQTLRRSGRTNAPVTAYSFHRK